MKRYLHTSRTMLVTEATTVDFVLKVSTAFDVTTDILVTTSAFVLDSPVWKFKRRGKSIAPVGNRTPDSLARIVVAFMVFSL
jgi:hypothetical protein